VAIDERLASSQYEPYCREGHVADQALKDLSFHLSAYMSASSNLGRLLVVDWASSHGPWDDMLAFIFDGGVLSADHQRQIRLSDSERDAYRFSDEQEAAKLLLPYVWRRAQQAVVARRAP
jgi:hypothetical protein